MCVFRMASHASILHHTAGHSICSISNGQRHVGADRNGTVCGRRGTSFSLVQSGVQVPDFCVAASEKLKRNLSPCFRRPAGEEEPQPRAKSDTCGVRTHALSEWRLEPPPETARPKCLLQHAGAVARGCLCTKLVRWSLMWVLRDLPLSKLVFLSLMRVLRATPNPQW